MISHINDFLGKANTHSLPCPRMSLNDRLAYFSVRFYMLQIQIKFHHYLSMGPEANHSSTVDLHFFSKKSMEIGQCISKCPLAIYSMCVIMCVSVHVYMCVNVYYILLHDLKAGPFFS